MIVRARGLSKRYDGREVLHGVDLDLIPGTITLVTGANGAGKSTLLRCVAGVAGCEGRIDRDGSDSRVAYLPQGDALPPRATAIEVIRLFGGGTPPASLVAFDTTRPIGALSGGERRRVALAAVFALAAPLLVLDEPLADLDRGAATAVVTRLLELRDGGATIVVAAPDGDVRRLAAVADRTVRLERGALSASLEAAS